MEELNDFLISFVKACNDFLASKLEQMRIAISAETRTSGANNSLPNKPNLASNANGTVIQTLQSHAPPLTDANSAPADAVKQARFEENPENASVTKTKLTMLADFASECLDSLGKTKETSLPTTTSTATTSTTKLIIGDLTLARSTTLDSSSPSQPATTGGTFTSMSTSTDISSIAGNSAGTNVVNSITSRSNTTSTGALTFAYSTQRKTNMS